MDIGVLHGLRALIVDDNATSCEVLSEQLQAWEMEPHTANDAETALKMLRQAELANEPYRVVLIDAHMPESDGFDLAEWIRDDRDLTCRSVMLLTSGDQPGIVARCDELGVSSYLLKPAKQSELFDAIVLALDLAPTNHESRGPETELVSELPPLMILLAEDSLVNQKLAVGLLERQGHQVIVANNGKEAVSCIGREPFDLVLMDVQMPEMDGLEATSIIRARERKAGTHVPIVAMTAHAMQGDREACLSAGMDGYIAKPIRAAKLFSTLASVLGTEKNNPTRDGDCMDWSKALEVVQGDRELLKDIVQAFLDECPKILGAIRTSIEESDRAVLQRAAHTLKSSMRYLGASEAFDRAYELECMGREGCLDGADRPWEALLEQIDRLRPVLTTFTRTGQFDG
jgi:CheY-like chemotaxis protein